MENKRNLKIKGGHFRGILQDSGITTAELSKKIGIKQVTLNNKIIGNCRFTLDDIFKILKVLNMTFEEVFICKD